ncbi:MAG: bifunctional pyr operon transcriptional regulator/uracil phosphoribosyltransferase PyrR [Victivallaceae bacterium]|nr:bifunctional pyr operon transcriptional regulator/uracil phosphoribosyltransferase PyrR [Victivallaceae bacterium]
MEREILFDAQAVDDAIGRVADGLICEFRENGGRPEDFALVGIHKQGVPLSIRIAEAIRSKSGYEPVMGKLDISMYRDDIGTRSNLPIIRPTEIEFDVNGSNLVLVDDILSTGRTIRAALDAVTDYGRPKVIRLAVLVDRHASEFPIHSDYAGINVRVAPDMKLMAEFTPEDPADVVWQMKWQHK